MTQPRNFSWFVEGRLAGMAYPRETDIPFLAENGVKTLVNLTRTDYYCEEAAANGVAVRTIDIPDFQPPSIAQINEFLDIVDGAKEVQRHSIQGMGGATVLGNMSYHRLYTYVRNVGCIIYHLSILWSYLLTLSTHGREKQSECTVP